VILQHVPGEGGFGIAEGSQSEESPEEQWRRATALATTLKEEELTDLYLSPAQLLYRLFNEDGVWVYDAATVVAGCRCSRQKILATLQSFSAADLAEMAIDGVISVTCQFCNTTECFSEGLG
jgi:molecular chaperone Hsp33